MSTIDLILAYFRQLGEVFWSVLLFQDGFYSLIQERNDLISVSLGITFLGGVSLLIGQSVILFFNRISMRRAVFTLLLNGLLFSLGLAVWAIIIWAIGRWGLRINLSLRATIRILLLTAAPMVFAFLAMIPYLGSPILYVLQVWSLLLTILIIQFQYQVGIFQTMVMVGSGWLIVNGVTYLFGGPLIFVRNLIRGNVIVIESDETVMQQIIERGREEMNQLAQRFRGYDH